MATTTRLLVIVQLDNASNIRRVANDAPGIVALIKGASNGESEQVFRSNDGVLFGFFIKTSLPEGVVRARFNQSEHTTNKDAILIVDVGSKLEGIASVALGRGYSATKGQPSAIARGARE